MPEASMSFEFLLRTSFTAGPQSTSKAGEIIRALGVTNVLVVTDRGIVEAGLLEPARSSLEQAGVDQALYDSVVPNPRIATVTQGLRAYRENRCDGLLAVGGGSPMDTAKAIGVVATNGGTIDEYEYPSPISNPPPPLLVIPTTYGTGSEATSGAVITNEHKRYKFCVDDPSMAPIHAILDPLPLLNMPSYIAASTGMDALTHAIEAYTGADAKPIADALCLDAIRLIAANLPIAATTDDDLQATSNMLYASTMAGIGLQNSGGLGLVHAMAHALGGTFDLPHGVVNAILLPWVMEFNLPARPNRFVEIARAMGESVEGLLPQEAAEKAVEAARKLSQRVGVPQQLGALGVDASAIPHMAEWAFRDPSAPSNPRSATMDEITALFESAL